MEQTCKSEYCDRRVEVRGFCKAHYERFRIGKPVDSPLDLRFSSPVDHIEPMPCRLTGLDHLANSDVRCATVESIAGRSWRHSVAYLADHAEHAAWMMTPQPDPTRSESLLMTAD